ncbi:MAG: (Fe-S)-binding protein [Verrucomicrobiia bacterium]|jgi:L-lactate dehydrogenase complex protein LldE
MKVTLFIPCYIDLFYPQVGISIVKIFERLGIEVDAPESPACCGQPAFNTGYWEESKEAAIKVMEQVKEAEVVVIPSGSCGAMMKVFYPELFEGTAYESLAKEVSAKCYEFTAFLVNRLGITDLKAEFPHKVTFHDGCHGLRELNNKIPPRLLLSKVKGLQLIEMQAAEQCCGFGGTFSAKFPVISTAMGDVKCASALETGAEYIASCDSSCLMHLQGLISRQKKNIKTIHIAEILAQQ